MPNTPKPVPDHGTAKVWETNPENPGEIYKNPIDGGIVPTQRGVALARALARKFGVHLEGAALDLYLVELARFCEAESGLPQQVVQLQKAAEKILGDNRLAPDTSLPSSSPPPTIVLPVSGGGRVTITVEPSALSHEGVEHVLAVVAIAIRGCVAPEPTL